jgi:hypothetical protein
MAINQVKKFDKDIAKKQADAIKTKAESWLGYINELSNGLNNPQIKVYLYFLRQSSLWATTFSFIEWLLVYSLYETGKTYLKTEDVAKKLNEYWSWSKELGKIFWWSGRNPIAHTGDVNPFKSYHKFNNLDSSVSFDSSNHWSEAVTGKWNKHHSYRGVMIPPLLEVDGKTIQSIIFLHQMFKDELLPHLVEKVTNEISQETDMAKLEMLYKLNSQIPH